MENKRKNIKRNEILSLVITLIIIVLVNIIGSFVYTRIDLTSEKRYTLSETSKEILKNLDDYVYFRVYLEGEFPAGFKKLRKETKEMLDEFRAYSKFIDYEFINPSESDDPNERMETYNNLYYQSRLDFIYETVQTKNGLQQIMIWPSLVISYRDYEMPVNLLVGQSGQSREAVLNNSTEKLEYTLISAIKNITATNKPRIGFTEGHGELSDNEIFDITQSLSKKYIVNLKKSSSSAKRPIIDDKINSLMDRSFDSVNNSWIIRPAYDALVIAKPTKPFTDQEKFFLDQYIMYGGKVVWFLDAVSADMDSLKSQEATMGLSLDLNLDDQLFKYGIKINHNLLIDNACAKIPIVTGQGADLQSRLIPWCYFPLLSAASEHPIVRNMNWVKADFTSSLEPTTSSPEIQKIPLLKTGDYTKVANAPVYISLEIFDQINSIRNEREARRFFPKKEVTAAYLLKGSFSSLYENRMTAEIEGSSQLGFKTHSEPTSMIVVADGDIIRNQLALLDFAKKNNKRVNSPLPLGYDQFTDETYGNKLFVENAITYLIEGEGLINIRSRELKIRLLDMSKVNGSQITWQLINVVLPSAIMIVFGIVLAILRKKKYTSS